MPHLRSRTSTHGRNMAGARALWRATGMGDDDFGKPIVAIANSYTQFVPGHVHLKDMGQLVAREIEAAGGVAADRARLATHALGEIDVELERHVVVLALRVDVGGVVVVAVPASLDTSPPS